MEGNPAAGTVKFISRGFAVLSVPLTMNFPQVILPFYVFRSNLGFASKAFSYWKWWYDNQNCEDKSKWSQVDLWHSFLGSLIFITVDKKGGVSTLLYPYHLVLSCIVSMSIPKINYLLYLTLQAVFCYWITSNLFSLTYGLGEIFHFPTYKL